ncbi:hypothetical protein D3C87_123920 [compost metagenome]
MRLFSDSFVSPAFEATEKTSYQFVGANIKNGNFSDDTLKMDVSGGVAIGAPLLNFFNISEFYVETRSSESETFYLGRKKLLWSEIDARWDLGLWEPLFKWNPLAPERQGLTGIFWQVDRPFYTVTLYGSPFFIPDQGPSFEIQNGSFVKGNPWFRRPPESIRVFNETTQIDYHFDRPSESQVVMHSSFGGKVSFGDPQSFRVQASYIYKPSNQLALGYDGTLDVAADKGNVDLQPQVFYHSLAGLDMTYKVKNWRFGVSATHDRPNQDSIFEEQWTHPTFENATLISPFIEWENPVLAISFQRLDVSGGKVTEVGELANPNRAPLMSRYPFRQANQISGMTHFNFGKGRRLFVKGSYTQSDLNDFRLIRLNTRLKFSRLWSVFGEAQLVDAGELTAENQNDIAQFVNNDRVMFGVSYVL